MNAQRLLAHYERIADAPEAIARLRRFILELAVRGKLVQQDRNDEPAAELLKRIAKEKARLVKAGEIRKPKASEPVRDDELPIELPRNWAWARLCEIGNLSGGMTPSMNRSDFWEGDIVWLSPKDIKSDEVVDSELKISALGLAEARLELYPPGCLFMVARSGILKRTFPVSINRVPAAANQDMKVLAPFLDGQERYLQIMFRGLTDFLLRELVKTGTTVQSLKYAEFEQQPFPLPPLAEQRRIVAKVDELLGLCDRLEAARAGREAVRDRLAAASLARLNAPDPDTFQADVRFAIHALPALTTRPDQIKRLRQTILNLAVRGKLVPQDTNDEPAAELLKRIAKEKSRLDRKERTKREPRNHNGGAAPIQLPKGWTLAPLAELVTILNGRAYKQNELLTAGTPVLRVGNLFTSDKWYYSNLQLDEDKYCDNGDLIFAWSASFGPFIWTGGKVIFHYHIWKLPLHSEANLSKLYLYNFLLQKTREIKEASQGISMVHMTKEKMELLQVPLPPLAEQHRIVAKVDELMGLCDRLEASLTATAATRRRLLDALLAEALAPVDARKMEALE